MNSLDKISLKLFTITNGITDSVLVDLIRMKSAFCKWVSEPNEADFFVFPCNYEIGHELTPQYLQYFGATVEDAALARSYESELIRLSEKFRKKIIIFFLSDNSEPLNIQQAIIFRTSIEKKNTVPNEHSMPYIKNDMTQNAHLYPEFVPKQHLPSIGFRGQVSQHLPKTSFWHKYFARHKNENQYDFGYQLRTKAVRLLEKSKIVNTDFHYTTDADINDSVSQQLYRENVFGNPYTLCIRGYGNYSFRLYEVLSAGRIPVFINTNCKLPFEDIIEWKNHVVWVEAKDINRIDKIVKEFHERHTVSSFLNLQSANKNLFLRYLSKEGFISSLTKNLSRPEHLKYL